VVRLLRALWHCAAEAWEGLWRNPALSVLSAASIGISLYVLGLFALLAFNLNAFVESLGREAQAQVFLKPAVTRDEIDALARELATDPAVERAVFVTSDEAKRRFQQTFPGLHDLPDRVGGDPFPASFELRLRPGYRDPEALERLALQYGKGPGVEEVRYDIGWVQRLASIVDLVRRGGYGLGLLLAGAAVVTVAAVVRLTVLARREEIEIQKLVGATAAFIRAPFALAAAAQGLAGGALAAGGLALTHHLLTRSLVYRNNPFMALAAGRFLPSEALAALALGGAVLGVVAAWVSLRRAGSY
jgi:cell division transport system permease protein